MATRAHFHLSWLLAACCSVNARCSDSRGENPDSLLPGFLASPPRHPKTGEAIRFYPEVYFEHPGILSPWTAGDATEVVVARVKDDKFAIVPVTLENGPPMDWHSGRFAKGRQLAVDKQDFPSLAATGLHDDEQLERLKTITGTPVGEITLLGRPGVLSRGGFMAADEDILSVLKGDNALVRSLGLTHPQMARPLLHVWNVVLAELQAGTVSRVWDHVSAVEYHGTLVHIKASGSKGFQDSLFDDEIEGNAVIDLWRALTPDESKYIKTAYAHLSKSQMDELLRRLTRIRMGDMEPYYVMRYGFYEGHTDWRVDPIAIAFVFGLKSLEQIDAALTRKLDERLTSHFTARK